MGTHRSRATSKKGGCQASKVLFLVCSDYGCRWLHLDLHFTSQNLYLLKRQSTFTHLSGMPGNIVEINESTNF
jgi:hypothetical protein